VLRLLGHGLRVNFQIETADGLVLCPSDPNDSNFMIDDKGNLWAIDFGRTCFLPASFVSYSLTMSSDVFVQSVAPRVTYPRSANLPAMTALQLRLSWSFLTTTHWVSNRGSIQSRRAALLAQPSHRCYRHAASVWLYRERRRAADFVGGVRTCTAISVCHE
jgi:hypothetical protein